MRAAEVWRRRKKAPGAPVELLYRLGGELLSFPLTFLAAHLPITPNQVSVLSIVLAAAGAVTLGLVDPLAGSALFWLSYLLDCTDGELARIRGLSSPDGELFDVARHQLASPLLLGGLALHALRAPPCGEGAGAAGALELGLALLAVGLSTRISGVREQVIVAALERGEGAGGPRGVAPEAAVGWLLRLARRAAPGLLLDVNQMNIVLAAALAERAGLCVGGLPPTRALLLAFGLLLPAAKLAGLAVTLRRGVVADIARLGRARDASE
jgi:phosphatidylglycerophosphate synthase